MSVYSLGGEHFEQLLFDLYEDLVMGILIIHVEVATLVNMLGHQLNILLW